jgi:hypothetical protein
VSVGVEDGGRGAEEPSAASPTAGAHRLVRAPCRGAHIHQAAPGLRCSRWSPPGLAAGLLGARVVVVVVVVRIDRLWVPLSRGRRHE